MGKYIPFPQADDIGKIITIINISNEDYLSDSYKMSMILGNISQRQVSYYLSAASYFGIIQSKDRRKEFTEVGVLLRNMNSSMQNAELINLVLQDPVFRKTFIYQKMYGDREIGDVENLIKEYHPECTNEVCHRRAQTVISWVNWILQKFQ